MYTCFLTLYQQYVIKLQVCLGVYYRCASIFLPFQYCNSVQRRLVFPTVQFFLLWIIGELNHFLFPYEHFVTGTVQTVWPYPLPGLSQVFLVSLTGFHDLESANMNGKQYCSLIFRWTFHQYLKYILKILIFFQKNMKKMHHF
jgi:hypothetical protein